MVKFRTHVCSGTFLGGIQLLVLLTLNGINLMCKTFLNLWREMLAYIVEKPILYIPLSGFSRQQYFQLPFKQAFKLMINVHINLNYQKNLRDYHLKLGLRNIRGIFECE